jgi:hypothetical protein
VTGTVDVDANQLSPPLSEIAYSETTDSLHSRISSSAHFF